MANTVTAFLETLVAASGDYNAAKVGTLSFLKGVYLEVRPEVARAGQTIQVYFPDVGSFTDQQANDWTPDDINPNYVSVVFNQRPGKAILVRDFEQWLTATDSLAKFYEPMYKRGLEYFNNQIATQLTAANFNSNPVITSSLGGEVTPTDAARAWNGLVTAKVPVDTPEDLSLFTHNDVHSKMMIDSQWYQENLVGSVIAQRARETGDLGQAFNFRKRYDQQAPKSTYTVAGTIAATNGSATVTGTGTNFTTSITGNSALNVTFAGDTTGGIYRVLSVASDTSLTLASNYTGPTITGSAATGVTYLCAALHRYSIALAVRPLELVNDGTVHSRLVMLDGIPFRVMLSYQHPKAGYLLTIDCGCAVKVIRPDFGVLIKA